MKTVVKFIGLGLALALPLALLAMVAVGASPQDGDKGAKPQTKTTKNTSKEDAQSKTKPVAADASEKTDKKDANSPEETASAENEMTHSQRRALDLLKQSGDEAASISDGRSAARIQANAADKLWDRENDYSKKLFDSAFDIAVRYYRDNKEAAQPPGPRRVTLGGAGLGNGDARMEVIRLAAKRDSALARKYTDQYLDEKKRERQEQTANNGPASPMDSIMGNVDPAANDLLSTATALLQTDQKAAIDLAQRAFAFGVPGSAPAFLAQLASKDQLSADQLYRFALDRLGGNPQATAAQVLLLAAYPFGDGQVWITSGQMTMSMQVAPPKGYKVSPPLIQQFLATGLAVIGRATELDPSQQADAGPKVASALFAAKTLQPKFAAFQPALTDDLMAITSRLTTITNEQTKQAIDQAAQNVAQTQNDNANANAANGTNTNTNSNGPGTGFGPRANMPGGSADQVKRMMDQAEKATDPQVKDGLYSQAALASDRMGETDRAFDIAGKISDRDFQSKTKSWLSFDVATRLMKEKHFDDAKRYASQVIEVDQYALLLSQMASEALQDKDQARATELLNDAVRKINGAADTQEKLRALLGIAGAYSAFDQVRGFEVVADAVAAANKIKDYDPEKNQGQVRSLGNSAGMNMRVISNADSGQDLSRTLGTLAKSDFDRALLLAQTLENKTLRISSQIAIASSAFEKKKPL